MQVLNSLIILFYFSLVSSFIFFRGARAFIMPCNPLTVSFASAFAEFLQSAYCYCGLDPLDFWVRFVLVFICHLVL